jgi:hypothetical protein
MRPLFLADLDLAARVLLALQEAERSAQMTELVATAELAHRYRTVTGGILPVAGDGSLLSLAIELRRILPGLVDKEYCS